MELERIKKSIIIYFAAILVFCSNALSAQNFATVDTRLLLILHPQMVGYDYNNGAFFRNPDKIEVSNKIKMELQKAQKTADIANEKISKQIKELESERLAVSTALIREMNVFAPGERKRMEQEVGVMKSVLAQMKVETVGNMDEIKVHNQKIKDLEDKITFLDAKVKNPASFKPNEKKVKEYKERIAAIDKKIAELNLEIIDNNDKAMSALYLTRKETEERLTKIRNELKEIITSVAAEENCSLVIDNTYGVREYDSKTKKSITSGNENPDVGSSALFRSFLSFKPDVEGIDTNIMSKEEASEHLILGSAMSLEQNLQQYLEYKDWVPSKVSDFTFGSLFISGGKDLTVLCAKRLFDKYDVPEYVRQRFAPKLSEYLNAK
ncbi:MAG: hypothetical protein IKO19_13515 [Candidatus Riflebacteria bacterium]|nr:hypothetical protein [Candidatus Riflebacteria bacterium]MBR4571671.1 hypothetical protein [Candidatus Riflebacteria bacterium]